MTFKKDEHPTYARYVDGECIQTARLHLLGIGQYCFQTSMFGEKPYENNMNMPMFDTAEDAINWIEHTGKWQKRRIINGNQ